MAKQNKLVSLPIEAAAQSHQAQVKKLGPVLVQHGVLRQRQVLRRPVLMAVPPARERSVVATRRWEHLVFKAMRPVSSTVLENVRTACNRAWMGALRNVWPDDDLMEILDEVVTATMVLETRVAARLTSPLTEPAPLVLPAISNMTHQQMRVELRAYGFNMEHPGLRLKEQCAETLRIFRSPLGPLWKAAPPGTAPMRDPGHGHPVPTKAPPLRPQGRGVPQQQSLNPTAASSGQWASAFAETVSSTVAPTCIGALRQQQQRHSSGPAGPKYGPMT